jgi:predicted  nucleic acid-binding Zn-ribbon protein
MAKSKTTTRRTTPKPPPGSAESIRRQTAELKADVALLKGEDKPARTRDDELLQAHRQLEGPLYEAKVWATLAERLIHNDPEEENVLHITRVVERLVEIIRALYDLYQRPWQGVVVAQTEGRAS